MGDNFKKYSRYYDLLYKDKSYRDESDYVVSLIKSHKPNAIKILDIGCGSGEHASHLVTEGLEICGIDKSEEMVAIANAKKIKNFSALVAQADDFHIPSKFDTAISLFHVISYLTSNQSLIKCFQAVNKHLVDDGLFIFDVWYSPAVYLQKPQTRVKRLEDKEVQIYRIAENQIEYQKNVVNVNFETIIFHKIDGYKDIMNEIHPMRHFSSPEIEMLATFTGFKVIKAEEFLTGKSLSENTWGACFVLQKITNTDEQ